MERGAGTGRKGVAWLLTEARVRLVLELEIELVSRHGLTLPPRDTIRSGTSSDAGGQTRSSATRPWSGWTGCGMERKQEPC